MYQAAKRQLRLLFHSETYRSARSANARKGGKLGGRGRASFSKELKGVRELVGTIIELLAYNRLPLHIDARMRDLLSLLKHYTTLAQYELRSAHVEDVEVKHANTQRQLLDTDALRLHIEDLVHHHEGERLEDPDDAA